ncbi:hypothetical protein ACFL43_01885 [Thermodesulfobacteriota bacterium]
MHQIKKTRESLSYLRGEKTLPPPKPIKKSPYHRCCIYNEIYEEIFAWGENAVKELIIPQSPNNKPNFAYYLEEYIEFMKNNQR